MADKEKSPLLEEDSDYTSYGSNKNQGEAEFNQDDIIQAARRIVNGLHDTGSGELHQYSPLYWKVHLLHYGRMIAMVFLLLLTFFERPWWCNQTPGNCENQEVFLFSNLPLASYIVTDIVELICLGILFVLLELRQLIMGRRDLLELAQSVIICLSVLDTFLALVWLGYREYVFLSPFLRPVLFVLTFKKIREEFIQVVSLIPIIFELLVLLLILMISFSWFGLILFYDEEEFEKKYFASYGEAMYNMFIFLTTANSPDVRMPMYWLFRPTVIYFIIFEVIGLYFILPFIFASVFNNYKDMVEAKKARLKKIRKTGLQVAFASLDRAKQGTVSVDILREVFLEVLKIYFPKGVTDTHQELIEHLLTEGDSTVSKEVERKEFRHLCLDIGNLEKFERTQEEEKAIHEVPDLPFHAQISEIILTPYFEVGVNCLLVLNGLFFAIQTYFFIHSIDDYYRYRVLWTIVEYTFSLIWVLEMSAKIYVLGLKGYVSRPANVFDGTIILLGLATTLLSHLTIIDTRVVRIVLLIRTFRLLRLFSSIPKFRMIFATFLSLLPVFSTLLGVLVFQYYVFGLIGIRAFGGLLYVGNPDLAGTAYEAAMYFPNNFNDFASTVVVLFDLMVINNWFIYMDAVALVTHSEASKIYFFLFYFFTNILTLNLLVANILDAVSGQMQKIKEEEARERETLLALSRHQS